MPRRDFLRAAGRRVGAAVFATSLAGCAAGGGPGRQFGWEGVRSLGRGRYRVQIWEPIGGHTTPIFVLLLTKVSGPPARIFESYGVTDRGETEDLEDVVNELRGRYPTLRRSDVEVESVVADGVTIGYVVKTRNIDVYADYDRRTSQYWVRLTGLGKYRRRPGGAGR